MKIELNYKDYCYKMGVTLKKILAFECHIVFYLTDAIYCKLSAVAVLVSNRILDDSIEMRDFPSVCNLMVTQLTG